MNVPHGSLNSNVVLGAVAALTVGLLLARLVPELTDLSPWTWLTVAVLLAARPLYHWFAKPKQP